MALARLWGALEEGYPVTHTLPFLALWQQEASSIVFHFYRALQTLSCVKMKGAPQLSKTVESINEPNTLSLHILIICVTISL